MSLAIVLRVIVQAEGCIPIGETCDAGNYNGECCNDEELTTCMDPYLRIGFDECVICASNGASCGYRTECCSNCCSDGVCREDYQSCNLVETFWIVAFWFMMFALIVGLGGYFLIKWICDQFIMVRIARRRVIKEAIENNDETTLIVLDEKIRMD